MSNDSKPDGIAAAIFLSVLAICATAILITWMVTP